MKEGQPSKANQSGFRTCGSVDAVAIELATGLTLADVEVLGVSPSPEIRADIAVKFAREFNRLARESPNKLIFEMLDIFTKDSAVLVRMCLAEAMRVSPVLPLEFARRMATDHIDIATPILRDSPVLDDATITEIIETKPEAYALAIADRKPLSVPLTNLLIEHKGTKRVAARLLDNEDAELSEDALLNFHAWGKSDPDIAARLQKRPNLPFSFINQTVIELTDRIQWRSLGNRIMTKSEATQLQDRFDGKTGPRCSSTSGRFHRLKRALLEDFEKGLLDPPMLLAFLHQRDIDRLECGFAVMTELDLQSVRRLLHGSDRRGLIALCLKAGFRNADYLAFRMALGLAEMGTLRERQEQRYSEATMKFACEQFEKMRANPNKLKRWLPS